MRYHEVRNTAMVPCLVRKVPGSDMDVLNEDGQRNTTFRSIIKCLFTRKKSTMVVDMKKESTVSAAKSRHLTLDRSTKSRKLLKMESMSEAPAQRRSKSVENAATSESTQRFLPSESPTAALLTYLNPKDKAVRRALSDTVKGTNVPPATRREAFNDQSRTRNTNYRSKRSEPPERPKIPPRPQRSLSTGGGMPNGDMHRNEDDIEHESKTLPNRGKRRKQTFVPGSVSGYDCEDAYQSEDEIIDLHDEMNRMNWSHPDLRKCGVTSGQSSDNENPKSNDEVKASRQNRPLPPPPSPPPPIPRYPEGNRGAPKKSIEEVIDQLYVKNQNNLNTLAPNGVENLDFHRGKTPDVEDLLKPEVPGVEEPRPHNPDLSKGRVTRGSIPTMDNLLNEVSVWAKDRQEWLLAQQRKSPEKETDSEEEGKRENEEKQSFKGRKEVNEQPVERRLSRNDSDVINGVQQCNTARGRGWVGFDHDDDDDDDNNVDNDSINKINISDKEGKEGGGGGFLRGSVATSSMPSDDGRRNRSSRLSLHTRGAFTTGGPFSDELGSEERGHIRFFKAIEEESPPRERRNIKYDDNEGHTSIERGSPINVANVATTSNIGNIRENETRWTDSSTKANGYDIPNGYPENNGHVPNQWTSNRRSDQKLKGINSEGSNNDFDRDYDKHRRRQHKSLEINDGLVKDTKSRRNSSQRRDNSGQVRIPRVDDDYSEQSRDSSAGTAKYSPIERYDFRPNAPKEKRRMVRKHSTDSWNSSSDTPLLKADKGGNNHDYSRINDSFDTESSQSTDISQGIGRQSQRIKVKESTNDAPFQLKPVIPKRASSLDRLGTPHPRSARGQEAPLNNNNILVQQNNNNTNTNNSNKIPSKLQPLGSVSERVPACYTFDTKQNKFSSSTGKLNGIATSSSFSTGSSFASRHVSLERVPYVQNERPFSDIPFRASDSISPQGPSGNNFIMATVARHDVSQNYTASQSLEHFQRPLSDSIPMPKRTDKVGVGQVLATETTPRQRQHNREFMNGLQKRHSGSFKPLTPKYSGFPPSVLEQERNSGYNKMPVSESEDNQNLLFGYSLNRQPIARNQDSDSRGSQITRHGADVNGGSKQQNGLAPAGIHNTAQRLRKLQRRDQELKWLMKDAAETEV